MLKVQIQKYSRETIAERANTEIQEGGYLAQIHSGLGVAQVRQLPVVLQQYNTVFLAVVMRMMVMKIDANIASQACIQKAGENEKLHRGEKQ